MIWRPVVAGFGTLNEVCFEWTIDDLMDANEVLDLKEAAEAEQIERIRS